MVSIIGPVSLAIKVSAACVSIIGPVSLAIKVAAACGKYHRTRVFSQIIRKCLNSCIDHRVLIHIINLTHPATIYFGSS